LSGIDLEGTGIRFVPKGKNENDPGPHNTRKAPAYFDEMRLRLNKGTNQFLFRDTLTQLILSPNL
jgi:hypothetical protein